MAIPIVIQFENNYPGLVLTAVTGDYTESPVPVSNSQFLIDADQQLQVTVHWDTTGSNPVILDALQHVADWEGEAVMHAISPSAATASVAGTPVAFAPGAASMTFTFAAGSLAKGIYALYVRVSLRDKPAIAPHFLPVNMVGQSNPILVFDAI